MLNRLFLFVKQRIIVFVFVSQTHHKHIIRERTSSWHLCDRLPHGKEGTLGLFLVRLHIRCMPTSIFRDNNGDIRSALYERRTWPWWGATPHGRSGMNRTPWWGRQQQASAFRPFNLFLIDRLWSFFFYFYFLFLFTRNREKRYSVSHSPCNHVLNSILI